MTTTHRHLRAALAATLLALPAIIFDAAAATDPPERIDFSATTVPVMKWADTNRLGRPFAKDPSVIRFGGRYLMYFSLPPYAKELAPTNAPRGWSIGIAESRDLRQWTKVAEMHPEQPCDTNGLCAPGARIIDGKVHLFYQTYGNGPRDAICHAISSDGIRFQRAPSNPIFQPTGDWNSGRAIDAEVFPVGDQLLLYFATRDPASKVQMLGVAGADLKSDFSRSTWRQLCTAPILRPELPWEKNCIEAPTILRRGDTLYLFYAGGYNNDPQQIGVATSRDGLQWTRLSQLPLLPNGRAGEWNSSESGHPGIFSDDDGRTWLFFQGNPDKGLYVVAGVGGTGLARGPPNQLAIRGTPLKSSALMKRRRHGGPDFLTWVKVGMRAFPLNARVHVDYSRPNLSWVASVPFRRAADSSPVPYASIKSEVTAPMKTSTRPLLLTAAALAAVPAISFAQPTAHYVPGVEGIKAASLPPPGFYLRDYNVFYFSHQLNGPDGHGIDPAGAKAFIYANVPRLVWITDKKLLGGYLGVDALLPLQYTDLQANTPLGRFNDSTFGIGDFFAEGTWSWHVEHFDVSVAYGVWAPTGDSAAPLSTLAGSGYWSQMITAGATWYPDKGKKFSVSALSRYEFNTIDGDAGVRPGQAYTLEWGLGYAPCKTADLGIVGYYQQQTTDDSPSGAVSTKDHVVALGPEISVVWPKIGLITSLRYLYEVAAVDRLQGQTVTLTFTKRF